MDPQLPLFSRPGRKVEVLEYRLEFPVRAAPHQAAFHEITGEPRNSPIGPAGMTNCGRYSPHRKYP